MTSQDLDGIATALAARFVCATIADSPNTTLADVRANLERVSWARDALASLYTIAGPNITRALLTRQNIYHEHHTLRALISVVRIFGPNVSPFAQGGVTPTLPVHIVLDTLAYLPCLSTIYVQDVALRDDPHAAAPSTNALPEVRTIKVFAGNASDVFSSAAVLLARCPSTQRLVLAAPAAHDLHSCTNLATLLRGTDILVRALEVQMCHSSMVEATQLLIDAVADTATEIRVDIVPTPSSFNPKEISFAQLVLCETIKLNIHLQLIITHNDAQAATMRLHAALQSIPTCVANIEVLFHLDTLPEGAGYARVLMFDPRYLRTAFDLYTPDVSVKLALSNTAEHPGINWTYVNRADPGWDEMFGEGAVLFALRVDDGIAIE